MWVQSADWGRVRVPGCSFFWIYFGTSFLKVLGGGRGRVWDFCGWRWWVVRVVVAFNSWWVWREREREREMRWAGLTTGDTNQD